ncbi:uncharacterized protein LOC142347844 [Convolutriloba macropyga]|uniref:uncharacterized protein LOC142347844 n=1 Tax=Convolutriloba macropyga TaxID=536237 RepID=UPI003F51EFB6
MYKDQLRMSGIWAFLVFVAMQCMEIAGAADKNAWVDIPFILTYSPNYHFMSSLRTIYTCNYEECKIACDEWPARFISVLRYDSDDQNCVCYDYPYAQLYHYLDNPVPDGTNTMFAVRKYLSRGMKPKANQVPRLQDP